MNDALVESRKAEVANAAAVHAEAVEESRAAQFASFLEESERRLANTVTTTMKEAFRFAFTTSDGEQRKFVDVTQLHRVCDDIGKINSTLSEIKENNVTKTDFLLLQQRSDLTNKIVLSGAGLILIAFLGGLTTLLLHAQS